MRARRAQLAGSVRGAAFLFAVLVTSACSRPSTDQKGTFVRQREVAKVFASTQPYAERTISEAELSAFLAKAAADGADSTSIAAFYRERNLQFAWLLGDSISENASAFVALANVDDADRPGATRAMKRLTSLYDRGFSNGKRVILCDSCAAELDLLLTSEYYRFVSGPHGGDLSRDLNTIIPPAKRDYRRLLDSITVGSMDLAAYAPIHPQYQKLTKQIQSYAKITAAPWPALVLPAGARSLKPGDSSAVIADIGTRLQLLGDLATAPAAGARYDRVVVQGVHRFQERHGMRPDGVIGADVIRALNVSPADRVRAMLINMERLRWVSEAPAPNRLVVNIPEYRLHVIEEGKQVMDMAVVVGNRATSTVAFSDTLTQIVFSPGWQVPSSIIRKEILPGIARDANYLAKHHMKMSGGSGEDRSVRQEPGATNPLGRVKFLFPNSYSIYMHDTPAKRVFEREVLTASHGCIRLSRAADLATFLLRSDPAWTPERMRAAMLSGNETFVKLTQPWPVSIVYFTAWVDRDGVLQFRDDVYGYDAGLGGELFARPDR
jgi:murein L,D-transpeptidase YcbB/YkuD